MIEGIINLLKPAGMTSHDGVSMLRRLTGIKRIGHTGTLDPMAVGVLPLCIGSTARISEYLDMDQKEYRCEMQLGLITDTLDIWGTVIEDNRKAASDITEDQIRSALAAMDGVIYQSPPSYSAVRVDGKRLYEYAREGTLIEGKKRPVHLSHMQFLDYDRELGRVVFQVVCSKGTYIRTICQDVGNLLGCGAAMSALIRTMTGSFTLSHGVTIEQLQSAADWTVFLLDADFPLEHFGKLRLRPERVKWFLNGGYLIHRDGQQLRRPLETVDQQRVSIWKEQLGISNQYENMYCVYDDRDHFLGTAVYHPDEGRYVADKVFNR